MSTVYWDGGGNDGDLSNTANYSGGSLPSGGDTLVFRAGTYPIQTGLTALSAIALALVQVTDGFLGNSFGTVSTPVSIQSTLLRVSSNTIGLFRVLGATTLTTVSIDKLPAGAQAYLTGVDITSLFLGSSKAFVDVGDSTSVTTFRTSGMNALFRPDATSPPDMEATIGYGASVESRRRIAVAHVDGVLNVTAAGTLTHSTAGSARCKVSSTGQLNLATTGTITRLERLPQSRLSFDGAKQDITIANDYQHDGAKRADPAGLTVTVTANKYSVSEVWTL